jgi:sphingomyelin phosphodiesterase 2
MRGAAERGHLVLGLGDFNMVPQSLAHRLILTQAPVRDVWLLLHPESSLGATDEEAEKARCRPIPTGIYNLNENGATCDCVFNTWRWNKAQQKLLGPNKPFVEVPEDRIDPKARRLDYIFASAGIDDGNEAWIVKTARVGMLSRHPELQCSLSDHFSVEATLVRSRPHKMDGDGQDGGTVHNGVLLQPPATSASNSQTSFQFQKDTASTYLPIHIYDEILEMIHKYRAREERQRRLRLGHFVGSVIISIGCLVAVWWSPRNFVAFLLMLLSTLGLSAGVIDGLIGGLFFGWEIRALKEFEWEISNVRAAASGTPHVMDEEGIRDLW